MIRSILVNVLAALAYLANVNDYYSNKMLLDMIPENERTSFVAKWLVNRVEVLSHQIINAECNFHPLSSQADRVHTKPIEIIQGANKNDLLTQSK